MLPAAPPPRTALAWSPLPTPGGKEPPTSSPFSPLDPARPGRPCGTEVKGQGTPKG